MSKEKGLLQEYSPKIKHFYHIITIGCQMNKSDSERIAGYLEMMGFLACESYQAADICVITTCGVRQSAENRVYSLVPKIKRENPDVKIILTGCLSEREDVKARLKDYVDIFLPIRNLPGLDAALKGLIINFQLPILNVIHYSGFAAESRVEVSADIKHGGDYLNINAKYESNFSAFVPIGNGCDNFCAYCVVPYARGREVYRPAEEIVSEVKDLVEKGYREITLIAQNVNSYSSRIINSQLAINNEIQHNTLLHEQQQIGKDLHTTRDQYINFADLLRMVNDIPGVFWIRFATSHPKDMSDELIQAIAECRFATGLRTGKVCTQVHLPAQAGDDEVLRNMNRKYSRENYIDLVKKIRKADVDSQKLKVESRKSDVWLPPVALTTDIIVGFPGETRAQFENTLRLFEEVRFDMAYIAQYSPRPGTMAAKLVDDVPVEEKRKREAELTAVLRRTALENNQEYIGRTVEVLVEGRTRKGEWIGRTSTGKNIQFPIPNSHKELVGNFVLVKIKSVRDFGMTGEIV